MGKIWTPRKKIVEIGYRAKNYASLLRAAKAQLGANIGSALGALTMLGTLEGVLIRSDGSHYDLGVLGKKSVTNAGVNFLVDDWDGGANDFALMNQHDSGTGVVAENVTDVGMGTPAGPARVAGAKSQPSANIARTIATIAYTGTLAITEHGIFSAATGVTLWDRTVFTVINVVNGDSIQFTYSLTITAGG